MPGTLQVGGNTVLTHTGDAGAGTNTINSAVVFPAGHVIATYQSAKTGTQAIANSWVLITDLTLTITPKLTPTKFLITAMISHGSVGGSEGMRIRIYKNGAELTAATGDASGSRLRVFMHLGANAGGGELQTGTGVYLDSNTGSSNVTYAIYAKGHSGNYTTYVNQGETESDSVNSSRAISTLTIQEIVP